MPESKPPPYRLVAEAVYGSPVHPDAIPPVPLHDERWDGDDPYLVCRLCGRVRDAQTGRVLVAGNARTCPHGDPTCPCQDGDPCHYEDLPGSPAMTPPGDTDA